ncbi:MAG: pseudoazurin [Ahrensia sp.]|nr:pseudoazurin [Ahrensia sp.]|tara:strand:+ start:16597 stop:17040 length:444 start_codon:yes stop_codon:yes gene_type:complete
MKRMIAMLALGAAVAMASQANAAEYTVEMLNKGEKGVMVFQPDFVKAEVGDTIRFVPTDKGHNVESIKGMLPDGADAFKGKFGQEVVLTVEKEGVYGVKCMPHYAMGMVALIEVGTATNSEQAAAVKHPGKAGKTFAELFGQVVASN